MFQCADDAPDGASKMLAEVARFKTKKKSSFFAYQSIPDDLLAVLNLSMLLTCAGFLGLMGSTCWYIL
jgi:hypothetical protein